MSGQRGILSLSKVACDEVVRRHRTPRRLRRSRQAPPNTVVRPGSRCAPPLVRPALEEIAMNNIIEAEGLKKRFGTTQALDGVDLAVPEGTVLGVLGPNGAGKTTAVRVLATLLRADSGRATVAGYDIVKDPVRVRQNIGLTGQY